MKSGTCVPPIVQGPIPPLPTMIMGEIRVTFDTSTRTIQQNPPAHPQQKIPSEVSAIVVAKHLGSLAFEVPFLRPDFKAMGLMVWVCCFFFLRFEII